MRLKLFLWEKKVWRAVDKTKLLCTESRLAQNENVSLPNFIHKLLSEDEELLSWIHHIILSNYNAEHTMVALNARSNHT